MSDTPRTDEAMLRADDIECGGTFDAVHVQVSHRLERELAEALEWKRMLSGWGGTPEIVDSFIKGQQERINSAQEAEKQCDEWKERYERLNESLAKNKRLFSSALAERIIDEQLQRIRQLESLYSEMQKEYHELKLKCTQ